MSLLLFIKIYYITSVSFLTGQLFNISMLNNNNSLYTQLVVQLRNVPLFNTGESVCFSLRQNILALTYIYPTLPYTHQFRPVSTCLR